jgi:hypothetical protein
MDYRIYFKDGQPPMKVYRGIESIELIDGIFFFCFGNDEDPLQFSADSLTAFVPLIPVENL